MQVYADQHLWGVSLTLSETVSTNTFSSAITNIVNIPSSLTQSGAIVLTGTTTSSGAKISFVVNGDVKFAVNFCSTDHDCVDPTQICIGIGSLGVCVPFGEFARHFNLMLVIF